MNKGLFDKLRTQFTYILLVERPVLKDKTAIKSNWLEGFTDGEGSFYVWVNEASTAKTINRVSFFFSISQSIRDSDLVYMLKYIKIYMVRIRKQTKNICIVILFPLAALLKGEK